MEQNTTETREFDRSVVRLAEQADLVQVQQALIEQMDSESRRACWAAASVLARCAEAPLVQEPRVGLR